MEFKNPMEFADHLSARAMDLGDDWHRPLATELKLAADVICRLVAACDGDRREADGRLVHNAPVRG